MALRLGVLHVGAATAADAAVPAIRAASAWPTDAWRHPLATNSPVAAPRPVPFCGPAGDRGIGSTARPPGPRGATGGAVPSSASIADIAMSHESGCADLAVASALLATVTAAVP